MEIDIDINDMFLLRLRYFLYIFCLLGLSKFNVKGINLYFILFLLPNSAWKHLSVSLITSTFIPFRQDNIWLAFCSSDIAWLAWIKVISVIN